MRLTVRLAMIIISCFTLVQSQDLNTWNLFFGFEIVDGKLKIYASPGMTELPAEEIVIEDTRFSEYMLSVMNNLSSHSGIAWGNTNDGYRVYRFYPRRVVSPVTPSNATNLICFGLGKNNQTGAIKTEVFLGDYSEGNHELPANTIPNAEFILQPSATYLQKLEFDYNFAALCNYKDYYRGEIVVKVVDNRKYLRFHDNPDN